MNDIQPLLDNYWSWLKDRTILKTIDNGYTEITTPYLDRHNDYIQIYTRYENGYYVITDAGETIADLEMSGLSINKSQKRKDLLKVIVQGFGLDFDSELKVIASRETFPLKKHSLIQAILAVNDMFYLAESTVSHLFYEDVCNWLDESDIRYTPRVNFAGKTGYNFMFDFVIPKSKHQPERIIKAVTNPNKTAAQNFIMAWLDTKDSRPKNSHPLAFLNDNLKKPSEDVESALASYQIESVLWTERDSVKEMLVA
jgi:hypothetical protein